VKVQQQDLFHGAALTQIVEHPSFKALNRASAKYGHYLVNTDREVFVKYRTSGKGPWQFTLQPDELAALSSALASTHRVFLSLVCGPVTVCTVGDHEITKLVDVRSKSPQWIKVDVPPRKSCRVSGSQGRLTHTVAHRAFPEVIFS